MRIVKHFIHGQPVEDALFYRDIYHPDTGKVQAQLCMGAQDMVDRAVCSAREAFPLWSGFSMQKRVQIMFRFRNLVEQHKEDLAALLSSEHGKILGDSYGDLRRGLDVIEFSCGMAHIQKGAFSYGVSSGIDVHSMRVPLGVVAGITPFNFPAMIPMWMFGIALACGNTFILKPSEQAPSIPVRLAELMLEAGAPQGVLNVVHGARDAVHALLMHEDIQAVSFVGSSKVARAVYTEGTKHGKRVQAMGSAKNHAVIFPDADLDQAVRDIIGAAYGSAGERCMALPVVVPIGEETAQMLKEKLILAIQALKVGPSTDASVHYGPLISLAHKERIMRSIDLGEEEGAELLLDGRGFSIQDDAYRGGYYLGPTLFDKVRPDMGSYQEEIFGPVLQIVRADSLEEAIALPSNHAYGNGVALYTRSGAVARAFTQSVHVGMVGINIPIPVPVASYSFGGWKQSAFGDMNQHGTEGMRFYTRIKTVTSRWPKPEETDERSSFLIPTHDGEKADQHVGKVRKD